MVRIEPVLVRAHYLIYVYKVTHSFIIVAERLNDKVMPNCTLYMPNSFRIRIVSVSVLDIQLTCHTNDENDFISIVDVVDCGMIPWIGCVICSTSSLGSPRDL